MTSPSSEEFFTAHGSCRHAPPDAFGPFRVLHQIGAGTLGPVFRAYDPERGAARRRQALQTRSAARARAPARRRARTSDRRRADASGLVGAAGHRHQRTSSAYLAQDYVAADSLDLAVREYGAGAAGRRAARRGATGRRARLRRRRSTSSHGALHPRDVLLSSDDTRLTGLGVARALEQRRRGRRRSAVRTRRPSGSPAAIWDRRADVFSLAALDARAAVGPPRRPASARAAGRARATSRATDPRRAAGRVRARARRESGRTIRDRARLCRSAQDCVPRRCHRGGTGRAPRSGARSARKNRGSRSTTARRSRGRAGSRQSRCCRRRVRSRLRGRLRGRQTPPAIFDRRSRRLLSPSCCF